MNWVLFEDNHLLVVVKPAGVLAQADGSPRPDLLTLGKAYLKEKYDKPGNVFLGLVHRLDRRASGLMVLARTSKAASRLTAQFRNRETGKRYQALAAGGFDPPEGELVDWLVRDGVVTRIGHPGEPGAREARLAYRVLESDRRTSLLEIDLFTGRKHQIRAQLAGAGHPICGDRLYGSAWAPRRDSIALVATRLVITHPTRGDRLAFDAPPGKDWAWRNPPA